MEMDEIKKQEEFLKYFLPNKERLSRFARAMCRNSEDAKDLVSDTILSSYEKFDRINNKDAFLAYLFSTASRIYKKKLSRKRFFGFINDEITENIRAVETTADVKLDIEILYKMLNQLPVKQKEAVVLFEISGLTLDEIKKIQGGTLSGVKSRLKRGREELTILMKDSNINSKNNMELKLNGTERKNGVHKNEVIAFNLKVQNE